MRREQTGGKIISVDSVEVKQDWESMEMSFFLVNLNDLSSILVPRNWFMVDLDLEF